MFGDVNISAILDSLSVSYDKRVRPNYGGQYFLVYYVFNFHLNLISFSLCFACVIYKEIIAVSSL